MDRQMERWMGRSNKCEQKTGLHRGCHHPATPQDAPPSCVRAAVAPAVDGSAPCTRLCWSPCYTPAWAHLSPFSFSSTLRGSNFLCILSPVLSCSLM